MMITVGDRQNIADIALQYAGSIEAMFGIARDNGVSIDGDIVGRELDVNVVDEKVTSSYANNDNKPGTYYNGFDNEVLTNDDASENIMYNEENIAI